MNALYNRSESTVTQLVQMYYVDVNWVIAGRSG